MYQNNRRAFLAEVGQGMIAATIGYGAAVELGLSCAVAADVPARLSFGPRVARRHDAGHATRSTAAGVSRQASPGRSASGTGCRRHAGKCPHIWGRRLHRLSHVHGAGAGLADGRRAARAKPRAADPEGPLSQHQPHPGKGGRRRRGSAPDRGCRAVSTGNATEIRDAVRDKNLQLAEQLLAAAARRSPQEAYDRLLPAVADGVEVHRTVLAYRAWDLLELVGQEHALTLLRQSLHYCVENCKPQYSDRFAGIRELLPKLLDQYRLVEREPQSRVADDAWIESMSETLFAATPDQAADAVAAALAEGIRADSVADAIALAANQLVLRDPGRSAPRPTRKSPSAASTATRSAFTPATRSTPGATSRGSAIAATAWRA